VIPAAFRVVAVVATGSTRWSWVWTPRSDLSHDQCS
jgi:hypothetical protein